MIQQDGSEPSGAPISRVDAEREGYTLSLGVAKQRTTLSHGKLIDLLSGGQLPAVKMAVGSSRWQWRMRPDEFEAWMARNTEPDALPEDPIPDIEAVAVANGGCRVRQRSATYARLLARLKRAARRGELRVYRIAGVTRWSRAEVATAFGGVPASPTDRYAILRQRLPEGRILAVDVPAEYGVHYGTAHKWAKEGRYGAKMIVGAWTFEVKELNCRDRAQYGRAELVPCCFCKTRLVPRTPSQLRHGQPHCDSCKETARVQYLERAWEAMRDMDPDVKSEVWSKGQRSRTDDRSAQRAACSDSLRKRWESSNTALPLAEASAEARGVTHHPERVKSRVLSRTHKGKAGRKRDEGQREILLGILAEVIAEPHAAGVSESELLASVGLCAWQRGVGGFRADIPASKPERMDGYEQERAGPDEEAFDPRWRKVVVDRVRRLIGTDVKALQIAAT